MAGKQLDNKLLKESALSPADLTHHAPPAWTGSVSGPAVIPVGCPEIIVGQTRNWRGAR